jgi:hypothetical protein
MSRFETIGPELDLTELAKHNRNLDRADADLTSLQQQISAEQQARMSADSAHASSSTAHPAQNITYSGAVAGAGNVKQAIDAQDARINNIVAGAGSSNTEIVDARQGLDGFANPVLKDRLDRMERRQLSAQNQFSTISRGVNVVNSDQASGATFKVLGCSLCNILGRDGGCESLTGFTANGGGTDEISSTQRRSGSYSIKFTTTSQSRFRYKDYNHVLDINKRYLVSAWVFVESWTSGSLDISIRDFSSLNPRYASSVNTSLIGQWQLITFKIPTSNTVVGDGFRLLFGQVTSGTAVCYWDEIRLYEVTAAEYAAIGTTITGEAIDRRWPYVDGVQHTQGLSLRMPGKNQFRPFSDGLPFTGGAAIFTVLEPYVLEFTADVAARNCSYVYDVVPNQVYTFAANVTGDGRYAVYTNDSPNPLEISTYSTTPRTFNSGNNTKIRLYFRVNTATKTTISNPMFILGDASSLPALFEPYNPQYAHAPIKLASNVDRTVADSYDSTTGQVFRRWVTGVKLSGLLPWTFGKNYTGFKKVATRVVGGVSNGAVVSRFDGAIFKQMPSTGDVNGPNQQILGDSGSWQYLSIANVDSGWIESIDPNEASIKALMNGWKANANNGSAYSGWQSTFDGSTPSTNNAGYVAANKAPGWDAYATLDYVRATPLVEKLTGDLGALVTVKGGNAVELLEGVIVREKVIPRLDSGNYFIQSAGESAFWGTSRTQYRTRQFLGVYKENNKDERWTIYSAQAYTGASANRFTSGEVEGANWYVDYIVLDKYAYTTNIVDATLTYQSTQGSVIAQNVQDIAAIKTHDGVQDWILAQYASRLLALEEA